MILTRYMGTLYVISMSLIQHAYLSKYYSLQNILYFQVCYGANCGGVGTIIGTGPNLVLFNLLNEKYPGHPLSFGSWMAFAVPIEVVSLLFLWIWLQLYFLPLPSFLKRGKQEKSLENTDVLIITSIMTTNCLKFYLNFSQIFQPHNIKVFLEFAKLVTIEDYRNTTKKWQL